MSTARYEMDKVDLSYFTTAPFIFRSEVAIRCTPQQLFACFEDADAWPAWALPITKVKWTSPHPYGIGTTRSVSLRGGMIGHEEFLAWEPYTHMAFRFNQCNKNILSAFAEDYRVTDSGNGFIHLTWTVGMAPTGAHAFLMKFTHWLLAFGLQRTLNGLKKYMEKNGQKYR